MKNYLPFAFIAAGLANILGVLTFSLGFQNPVLNRYFPEVFSNFGLLMIIVWGMAYLAVAKIYHQVPHLSLVFFIEKMVYVASAVYFWLVMQPDITLIAEESVMAAAFFVIYGLNDLLFGLMFFYAWRQSRV